MALEQHGRILHKWGKIFYFSSILTVIFLLCSDLQSVSSTSAGGAGGAEVRNSKIQVPSSLPLLSSIRGTLKQMQQQQQQQQQRHVNNHVIVGRELGVLQTQKRGVENPRAIGLLTLTAIVAIPLLIIIVILLFLPIPVAITTARMAREIVTSDECLERTACEVMRFSREMEYDAKWIQKFFRSSRRNAIWIERVSRGLHTTECGALACDPVSAFKRKLDRD